MILGINILKNKFMVATHSIQSIKFEGDYIFLQIGEKIYKKSLNKISKKLMSATEIERNAYKVSPSGYGIHWFLIDEDLSVKGLIEQE